MKKMKIGILLVLAVLALVSVASALPTAATGYITSPGPSSYWDVDISSTTPAGDLDLPAVNDYVGWCANSGTGISSGSNNFLVYSSLSANPVASVPTANWKNINWVLNNKGAYDWKTVQMVIWHFDGQPGATNYPWHSSLGAGPSVAIKAEYDALKAAAETSAASAFTPSCRQPKYAIILYQSETVQPLFVEGDFDCTNSPEFPSFALPVGMIVGLIGAVYVIKGREN